MLIILLNIFYLIHSIVYMISIFMVFYTCNRFFLIRLNRYRIDYDSFVAVIVFLYVNINMILYLDFISKKFIYIYYIFLFIVYK